MKSKFISFFQVKKTVTSEWILLFVVIFMIGVKFFPTSSSIGYGPNDSHKFFKKNGIDTRYDYVEPQVDVMPQW